MSVTPGSLLTPAPGNHRSAFLDLSVPDILCKWLCDFFFLHLASFISHDVFEVHAVRVSVFTPLCGQIPFCRVDAPCFICVFCSWWAFWVFQIWLPCVMLPPWTFAYRSFCVSMFSALGLYLKFWNCWVMYGNSMFNFWGTAKLFTVTAASFYIPTSTAWRFQIFHILANSIVIFFSFWKLYPS